MTQIFDTSIKGFQSRRLPNHTQFDEFENAPQVINEDEDKNKLKSIVKKYRLQQYIQTFRQKIKRNNIYQPPAIFELQISEEDNHSFLHIEGLEIKNKWIESFIFAGDIVFSLIIFIIAIFQAFLQGFRTTKSSSFPIIFLKVIAILFQFSKLALKSIKKDMVNGKLLTHIDDLIWESAGIIDLTLYISAITLIILTIVYPQSYSINAAAFVIATIKLFKIPINLKVLDLYYINSQRKQSYWNLIKVVIFELIFMNFIASMLLAMSTLQPDYNWLIAHSLNESEWDVQYYWAMYWSATLVTTTGFGDFIASNTKQAIVVAFLELFSSVVLVYNLNIIGTIIMSLRDTDQNLQKKLGVFRRMSDQSPVSPQIQQSIHSYLNHENEINQNFQYIQRKRFLDGLPQQLKAQYENDVNQTIFRQLPFFRNLRLETLNSLALLFDSKVYYPGQNLMQSKKQSSNILILKKGQVFLQFFKIGATFMNNSIIDTIKTVGVHPKAMLLSNTFMNRCREINYNIKANDYSLIMSLPQIKFMETIRKSDIEKQHFFTIYDKHENNFIFESTKCIYCTSQYHNKFQCPKLHFIPFTLLTIRKHLLQQGKKQPRIHYLKKVQRKEHCYYLRKEYYQAYQGYRNIMTKIQNPTLINRIHRMKTLAQKFDRQDLLESFESLFRKIVNEEKTEIQGVLKNIEVDSLHDYLSYFIESNPKELQMRHIKKKVKTLPIRLKHKLTLLAASSKKNLFRPLNQFQDGYSQEEQFLGPLIIKY